MLAVAANYKTAVSLVVYNGAKYLPYTLAGLAKQTNKDFFLLIIDNGSIDDSLAVIKEWLLTDPALTKRSRLVSHHQNLGFAKAHNQAIQWTGGEYVLLLNQDVLLEPDYLTNLVNFMDQHQPAGSAQGKILKWQFQPTSYRLDQHRNLHKVPVFDSGGLAVAKSRHTYNLRQGEFDQGQAETDAEVFGVVGTVPLYRRRALQQIADNGQILDEDFVSYKEDVDLAWRLRWAGFEAWYVPRGVAYHDRSLTKPERLALVTESRAHWPPQLKVYSCRNHWLVLLKNDCLVNLLIHAPAILWYELKKFIYRLLFETRVLLKALAQFIVLVPAALKKRRVIQRGRQISCGEIRRWLV